MPSYSSSQLYNGSSAPSGPVVALPLRRINDDGSTASTRAVLIQPLRAVEGPGRHSSTSSSRHHTASRSRAPSSSSSRNVVPGTQRSNVLPSQVSDAGAALGTDWMGPGSQSGSHRHACGCDDEYCAEHDCGRRPSTGSTRHTHRTRNSQSSSSRTLVPSSLRSFNARGSETRVRGSGSEWTAPRSTRAGALAVIPDESGSHSSSTSRSRRASDANMALVPYSRGSELRRGRTVAGTSSARASQLALTRTPSTSRTAGRSTMPPSSRRLGPVGAESSSTDIEIRIRRSNAGGDHVQVRIGKW
jgi:hypothetical protein